MQNYECDYWHVYLNQLVFETSALSDEPLTSSRRMSVKMTLSSQISTGKKQADTASKHLSNIFSICPL